MSIARPPQYKIVLVGAQGVGKSALVERLAFDWFTEGYKSSTTTQWVSATLDEKNTNETKIFILNTPGNEKYASSLVNDLRNANGIVFLFDATKPYNEQIKYFNQYVAAEIIPQDTKCYVVISKTDLPSDSKNEEEINNFKLRRGITTETIRCSAKNENDLGIKKLKQTLAADLSKAAQLKDTKTISTPAATRGISAVVAAGTVTTNKDPTRFIPTSDISKETATQILTAFMKIYKAMRDGESSWFRKTNYLDSINPNDAKDNPDKVLNTIIQYAAANPKSRTATALQLAQVHLADPSPNNGELFQAIYRWSFDHSGWIKKSNLTGESIFTTSSLDKKFRESTRMGISPPKENDNTRSAKIYRALKGGDDKQG